MMNYGLNSGPTSSLRHINEINHKRGLTHLKSYKPFQNLNKTKTSEMAILSRVI